VTLSIDAIYRYPIKGLTAEVLSAVTLSMGQALPFDRAYAIENGPSRFNESDPKVLYRAAFVTLARNARLAAVDTRFDEASQTLTLLRSGKMVARGDLTTRSGRAILEQFFAAYLQDELRGAPKIRHAVGHSFGDADEKSVHIITKESIDDLGCATGRPLDPLRFRPNIVVSGGQAWAEFSWVGKDIELDGARLHVYARTARCASANVDLVSAARDADIPAILQRHWGHANFGVYARVTRRGDVQLGATAQIL
jgi:uncharacterized protein